MAQSSTVNLPCTDLVGSTAYLQQAVGQTGAHLFQAHHKVLSDAVTAVGGGRIVVAW